MSLRKQFVAILFCVKDFFSSEREFCLELKLYFFSKEIKKYFLCKTWGKDHPKIVFYYDAVYSTVKCCKSRDKVQFITA